VTRPKLTERQTGVLRWIADGCPERRPIPGQNPLRAPHHGLPTLRNLAIGALRLAGRTDITEATRWACRHMTRPFMTLGLTARS
jgi:hypothetical protein